MLGYGDVVVETASERLGAFTFDLISAPEAFRNAIWGHAPTVGGPGAGRSRGGCRPPPPRQPPGGAREFAPEGDGFGVGVCGQAD